MTEKIQLEPLALLHEETWLTDSLRERNKILSHFRFTAEKKLDENKQEIEALKEENAQLKAEIRRLVPKAEIVNGL